MTMRFIQLTKSDNLDEYYYVGVDHINYVNETASGTSVHVTNGNSLYVAETPKEIWTLMFSK